MMSLRLSLDDHLLSITRIGVWLAMVALVATSASGEEAISFRRDVAPILMDHCVACHCARKAEGGYRLDAYAEMVKPGDSGVPPLQAAQESEEKIIELVRRVTTDDESERMPLDSEPLNESQIQVLSKWIQAGAEFDGEHPEALLPMVIPPREHPVPPETYPSTVPIIALAFSPDGNELVTGGYHEILVWSVDGKLQRRISNLGQQIFSIAFHPDGKRIAVACGQPGREGEVRLVDASSGAIEAILVRSDDVVLDVAFRSDGKQLAVACADKSIRLVDMESLEEVRVISSHADWVTSIAWNADGKRLVSGSRDKSAKVFDMESGQLLGSYQGHGAAVRGVAFLSNGTEAVSSGGDNKAHRWNIESTKKVSEVGLGGEGFKIVSSDSWIIVPTSGHQVLQIEPAKNQVIATLKGQEDWVLSAAVNEDQSLVASGAYNGEVKVWQIADGAAVHAWTAKP